MTITVWDLVIGLGVGMVLAGLYFIAWPLPLVVAGAGMVALGVRKT